ncbi:4-hydroxybutyrate dehydrogenase [Alkalilimnicola ehrlichii]|uniref:4-hydroxybutyrate dehydrogenase n=1 Tax=Alkalilimnicola ehrlichii TaxID=351052 RepID=A0A3E0WVV0_9GAMM|nr:iron-containing alcohol dehydrogenase [Alkalilimnicola ehrlichii]RFA29145.1 4-hydroxybutyrate dehydrogenase [Alkalilimnicola ehrlichii]RFA36057.1 4-hydroxybutyrate dehydrogenase [Alkalilimnicola ehrlichii]
MTTLNYLTTTHFDFGITQRLGKELSRFGVERPLFITDEGVRAAGLLDKVLGNGGIETPSVFDQTPPNPTQQAVMAALEHYRADGCDGVVCVGGGSPIDLGKAVALLAGSGGDLERYDPMQGGAKHITKVAPLLAIPTTAGTGSEVSMGFVIVMDDGRKATFASPKLVPKVALCDPELTLGLPAHLTAATGMDAIAHCIEAVLSPVVNPPAEGVGLDGLWRAWRNIQRAVEDGSDREARWHMMMASTEGAMAFVKGLGAVHAMSHAAGRLPDLKLHHGTLNAVLLPAVLRFNKPVAEEKMERLAQAMGLPKDADLAEEIERMNASLKLPATLGEMGVTEAHLDDLVYYAVKDLAGRTNPRQASAEDYRALFEQAL